jgi:hypothetical protein
MRLRFASALFWVMLGACQSSPEQATSPLLYAVSMKQPAGTGRYCDRFLEGSSRRVHHWECFRDIGRGSGLDSGPWTEERIFVSREGVVQEARTRFGRGAVDGKIQAHIVTIES